MTRVLELQWLVNSLHRTGNSPVKHLRVENRLTVDLIFFFFLVNIGVSGKIKVGFEKICSMFQKFFSSTNLVP